MGSNSNSAFIKATVRLQNIMLTVVVEATVKHKYLQYIRF